MHRLAGGAGQLLRAAAGCLRRGGGGGGGGIGGGGIGGGGIGGGGIGGGGGGAADAGFPCTTLSFAEQVYDSGQPSYRVAVGDMDNDGRPDILVANNASNTVTL